MPLAAPSANRSGRVSPTSAAHVLADLDGHIDIILDGGPALVGVESTIISCLDEAPVLLRPGGVAREAVERALGRRLRDGDAIAGAPDAPLAPGLLASHYAPRASVRLNASQPGPGEAALDFGGRFHGSGLVRLDLSPAGDLREAAAALFGHLRALDATGAASIAVAPIPATGLGEAINDRLFRAAAPRPPGI